MGDSSVKPIKLLVILPDLLGGGAERVVLNMLRNLNTARFKATLFLIKRQGVYWEEVPKHVRVVCGTKSGRIRFALPLVFMRLLREGISSDILIGALELNATYFAYIAGRLLNKLTVGWVHIDFANYIRKREKFHQVLSRWVYGRINKLVFVSHGAAESLSSWLGEGSSATWAVIYNSFDLSAYALSHTSNRADWAPRAYSRPVVIAIGRLVEQKGFDLLIYAHSLLIKQGVLHHLVILGEGPLRLELERLSAELGVADSVFMPGFVNRPGDYLQDATVFVLPSRYEGFGMVLLEAMASGLPVIASDCPSGPAEILEGGTYGLLVPSENPQALAEAVGRFLADPVLRERYKSAGAERLKDFFPERIMPQWEKLLLGMN